ENQAYSRPASQTKRVALWSRRNETGVFNSVPTVPCHAYSRHLVGEHVGALSFAAAQIRRGNSRHTAHAASLGGRDSRAYAFSVSYSYSLRGIHETSWTARYSHLRRRHVSLQRQRTWNLLPSWRRGSVAFSLISVVASD